MVNEKRVKKLNDINDRPGPVVYWMSRDQRIYDNWALLFAQQKAVSTGQELHIVFSLVSDFAGASLRHYDFLLNGLKECELEAFRLNIPFHVIAGMPDYTIPRFIAEHNAGILVSDFDPLKIKRLWKKEILSKISIPFYTVDAHNIVPVWEASPKQEFGAYTIRPKIKRKLDEFLEEFPEPAAMENTFTERINWDIVYGALKTDTSLKPVSWIKPGPSAAYDALEDFLKNRLELFASKRNDPNVHAQSGLSPYFHFGHLSAQRAALNAGMYRDNTAALDSFLEELIIRRELSDNFCFYNNCYDSFNGFPDWAKKTLNEHRQDKRDFLYTVRQLEDAETHDDLWNAAQIEMAETGKMHGYMRMYWAKKILEWTPSPEDAAASAIYLNDKYELDGRDPNGYTGIAWSIGGVHDRAWGERPIFGKIRYMSYNGCKSKFDIKKYISKYI